MGGEWRDVAIGQIAEIFDGPHATPPKTDSGPIFLGISNLAQGRLDLSVTEHLSDDDYGRWTRRVTPKAGDVVFSYETRLGEAAFIPSGFRCCLGRRMGLLRARPGKVDARFLLYAYLGPRFQETLRSRTIPGSTVDRIPLIDMPSFPIEVPKDINEQRAIAHILGTLDDKIELNQRMNETLEAMARALFESGFENSGGSRIGTFSEVVQLRRDPENPLDSPDTVFAHFSIPAFDEGQSPVLERGESIKSLKSRVPARAILLSKLNPEIERVWRVDVKAGDRAVCSTEFLVLCPRDPFDRAYVYCLARSPAFRRQIEALVTGTSKSHQRAHADAILKLPVVLPTEDAVTKFQKAASPLLDRALACRRESRTLAELRDSLLPKLISGALRVSRREKIARETA